MDLKNILKPYNNPIGKEISERNIPYFRILKETSTFQVGLGYKQKRFLYDDINSAVARKICNNKNHTKYLLEQNNFPIPKGEKIHSLNELKKIFKKIKKPIVIKPISEMWGKGITTNIKTLQEATSAYKIASKHKGDYVIMEEYVQGEDHRILFIGGKFIAALKRTPPQITGNGRSTIKQLINKKNTQRKGNKSVKPVLIDDTVRIFLKKQGLSLESILPKEKKINIRMTGNICSGGTSENVTEKVHPSIIKIGKEIISLLDLEIGGIDIITTDISKSLHETKGKISEVNQNPDIVMHTRPCIGKSENTIGAFIDHIFRKSDDAWIDIIKEGKKIYSQKELNKYIGKIPVKVFQKLNMESKKEIIISNPDKPLLFYLLSNLTTKILLINNL